MLSLAQPHFWLSLFAALLMAALVAAEEFMMRGLLVVPLILCYYGSLVLFGIESDRAFRAGLKKQVTRLLEEFERQPTPVPQPAEASPAPSEEKRRVSPEAVQYVMRKSGAEKD